MRIVIKIGTSTLTHASGHLNIRRVAALCKAISDIRNAGHELILQDPPPFARIISHGESAVVFVVRAWCLTEHYDIVRCDLLELIKREFDRRGISFPFPQLDVHLDPK